MAAHKKLLKRQREYLFVGGLPEAVQVFIDEGYLTAVTAVQRSIADTFQDDFAKYAKQKDLVLLQQIFRYIPKSLGKKVKYSNMVREEPSLKVKNVIRTKKGSREVAYTLVSLPLYMAEELPRILHDLRKEEWISPEDIRDPPSRLYETR